MDESNAAPFPVYSYGYPALHPSDRPARVFMPFNYVYAPPSEVPRERAGRLFGSGQRSSPQSRCLVDT
jgi:hypothetical protein